MPADDLEEMEDAIEAGETGSGVVSDGASNGEESTGERLPIYHEGMILNPDDADDIWGRISVVREGQPSEAVSVYCRRHGCSVLKRTKDALTIPEYLRCFQLGQDLPKDRSASMQHRHKKMLADV